MEDYGRSGSYGPAGTTQIEPYHGPHPPSYDLRSYSTSYAQTQMANGYTHKDFTLKKSKTASGSASKPWGVTDPEFQRKKRVASYKMYSVEGKVKGTFRKSFRWLKDRYTRAVYGWW